MKNPSLANNIVENHDFANELQSWRPCPNSNSCSGFVVSVDDGNYAVVTNRTHWWEGLEQDITARVSPGSTYTVSACVGVSGPLLGSTHVIATLKLENNCFLHVGNCRVSKDKWEMLEGTFSVTTIPKRILFYLEGPCASLSLLVRSVVITRSSNSNPTKSESASGIGDDDDDNNIVLNPHFEDGVNHWSGRGCQVALHGFISDGKIVPQFGKVFASATMRGHMWSGIQQEITSRVLPKVAYKLAALVRIYGNNVTAATVQATLEVQTPDGKQSYIAVGNMVATDKEWMLLEGKFFLNFSSPRIVLYVECPPPGTDILLNGLVVKQAEKTSPLPLPALESLSLRGSSSRVKWEKPPKVILESSAEEVIWKLSTTSSNLIEEADTSTVHQPEQAAIQRERPKRTTTRPAWTEDFQMN